MPKIEIFYDQYELADLADAADTMVVHRISEYVDGYGEAKSALHADRSLRLLVRDATCYHWLSRLQQAYGKDRVDTVEYTPRNALRRKWGISPPEYVTDDEIVDAGLLSEDLLVRSGDDFATVILDHFYHPLFSSERCPVSRIVDLVNCIVPEQWEENRKKRLVHREYERRIDLWMERSDSERVREIVVQIREDPEQLTAELETFKVLSGYPSELGKKVMGDRFTHLRSLKLDLDSLPVNLAHVEHAAQQIEFYLNNLDDIQDREDIQALLQMVSGCLVQEFAKIRAVLLTNTDHLDRDLLNRVQRKFSPIADRIGRGLRQLDTLLAPQYPSDPNPEWNVEEWLGWAVAEYLPYHSWLEEHHQHDPKVAEMSEAYATWLYQHFSHLRANFDHMVFRIVPNVRHELMRDDEVSLFLIIDNFGWVFFQELRRRFERAGYFCPEVVPYLSMIPSETEVSKKCLVSGEPEYRQVSARALRSLVEQDWGAFLEGRTFVYLQDLHTLQNTEKRDAEVYFLNYRAVDDLLHSDEKQTGIPHTEEIGRLLDWLVASIVEFAKRLNVENRLAVYVCSDHGSTKIKAEVENFIDRKYYNPVTLNRHHRFVTISAEQLARFPDNARHQCFVIEAGRFGTTENYLISRDYYRFVETDDTFYVHGGLTPEETIVPFAAFRKVEVKPQLPVLTLLVKEYRYQVKTAIKFEVGNPNDYEIADVEIHIGNANVEADTAKIESIPPKKVISVEIPARFRKTVDPKEQSSLALSVRYYFLGKDYRETLEPFAITMRSMVAEREPLDIF